MICSAKKEIIIFLLDSMLHGERENACVGRNILLLDTFMVLHVLGDNRQSNLHIKQRLYACLTSKDLRYYLHVWSTRRVHQYFGAY